MGTLVAGTAIGLSTKTFSAILVANQQVHIDNLIKLLLLLIRTCLTVGLLQMGWGLYSLAVANLAATIATSCFAVVRTYRLLPHLKIRRQFASWDVLKSLGGFGAWLSLGGVAGIVITSLDRVVTAKLISIEMVTTLSLTSRAYALFGGLLDQITNTARPMLGQMLGQHKLKEAELVYRHLFALSSGSAVVVALSLWAGNEPFVTRWVGAENFGGSWLSLALALNLIVNSWVLPNRALLSSATIARPQTLSRLVEAALNLGLSLVLGRWLGLIGIIVATTIAGVLTSTWYLPLLTARLFGRPWLKFLREDALPVLLVGACLFPVAWASQVVARHIGGFIGAGLGASLAALVGFAMLWWIALDDAFRTRIRSVVLDRVHQIQRPPPLPSAGA
jgi:O-antigen/teichoic acid export membrane protein